jgi:hypothetical protein
MRNLEISNRKFDVSKRKIIKKIRVTNSMKFLIEICKHTVQ